MAFSIYIFFLIFFRGKKTWAFHVNCVLSSYADDSHKILSLIFSEKKKKKKKIKILSAAVVISTKLRTNAKIKTSYIFFQNLIIIFFLFW